jgi:hypothetical protein
MFKSQLGDLIEIFLNIILVPLGKFWDSYLN